MMLGPDLGDVMRVDPLQSRAGRSSAVPVPVRDLGSLVRYQASR